MELGRIHAAEKTRSPIHLFTQVRWGWRGVNWEIAGAPFGVSPPAKGTRFRAVSSVAIRVRSPASARLS